MKRVLVKNTKENIATRANELVQGRMKPTIHNMEHTTVNDRRFLLWVISCVQPQDTELKEYELPLKEFAELSGISPQNTYAEARKICKRVMGLVVELEGFDESGFEESTMFNLIHKATHKKATGTAVVRIHEDMAPFLLDQKENFTKIKIAHYMPLRSTYAQLLYEQIKVIDWRTNKAKYTLDELRVALEVKEGSYQKRFSTFENRVIKKAVEEISNKTDIVVTYEKIKRGRKIHAIEFTFETKTVSVVVPPEETNDLVRDLVSNGLSKKKATAHAENKQEKAKNALKLLQKQENVRDSGAWLNKAIQEDYQDSAEATKKKRKDEEQQRMKAQFLREEAERKEQEQKEQYSEYQKSAIEDYLNTLSDNEKFEFITEYWNRYPPLFPSHKKHKNQESMLSIAVRSNVIEYIQAETKVRFKSKEEFFDGKR